MQPGYESENAVLENQHQHRCESAKSGQQFDGGLVDENGDTDYYGDEPEYADDGVEYAAQGEILAVAGLVEARPYKGCDRAYSLADDVCGVDEQRPEHDDAEPRILSECEREQRENHQRRNNVAAMYQHMVLDQFLAQLAVAYLHEFSDGIEDYCPRKPAEEERESDDYRGIDDLLY